MSARDLRVRARPCLWTFAWHVTHENPTACDLVNRFSNERDSTKEVAPSMLVRDAMSTVVLTIGPAHTLRQAAPLMSARRVGAAVVLDPDTSGLGILTERDILNSVGAGQDPDQETRTRPHHHRRRLRHPGWTLEEAAAAMTPRRLPAPDRAGRTRAGRASSPSATSSGWLGQPRTGWPRTPSGRRRLTGRAPATGGADAPEGPEPHGVRSLLVRQAVGDQPRRAWTAASSRLP